MANGSSRDERRLFTWRQKLSLLRIANFKCQRCGASVVDSKWHAHHKNHHSDGGQTEICNGEIVCESCHKEMHNGVPTS